MASTGLRIVEGAAARDFPIPDCQPRALSREGARIYVACGTSGLVVLDATEPKEPVIVARVPTDGDVVALHLVDGKVWVEIARVEARPASALVRSAHLVQTNSRVPSGNAPPVVDEQPPTAASEGKSLIAPQRRGGLWEVDIGAQAFLPIGNIGFGLLGRGSVGYRFDAPVAIYGELAPIGVAVGKQGTIGTGAGHVIASLDVQLFEVGLGFGAATLNSPAADSTKSLSLVQIARVGARDGLAVFATSDVIVDNDKFALGALTITGQVPVASRWWMILRGGGGPIGFAYGDLGVRYLVAGDLGPGSFLLTGTIGGAGIFKTTRNFVQSANGGNGYFVTAKSATYEGPALGIWLEWRL